MLDTAFAGRASNNRWNAAREPALYIAGDRDVALAEFARHLREGLSAAAGPRVAARSLYQLHVRVGSVLDLRDPAVHQALGLQGGLDQFLNLAYARATATFVRRTSAAEAVLVPSMAFLDDPARWNLVLFLEKLPSDLTTFITTVYDGEFRVEVT